MRRRDIRRQRIEHNRANWQEAWRPIEPDPEGDQAWLDAVAEAHSGTDELNRRTYERTTQDKR
jgi:hypothetical protein